MFEHVPAGDLLIAIAAVEHDFEEDMGASRVDVIAALDRVIRHARYLPGLTPARAGQLAERIVISLDVEAAAERARRRREDVRVSLTAHLDGIASLLVQGPAEQLAAAHHPLEAWALGLCSAGDER